MAGDTVSSGSVAPARSSGSIAPVIQARNISRRFGARVALSDVSMEIHQGDIFGVLGPDGAGKTTLMQIFAAILDPSEGRCSVLGYDTQLEDAEVNARVGYMSQGFTLYGRLSVDENLRFAGQIRGVTRQEYAQRSKRLLAMAGLTEFHGRWAEKLSGGMRKKLSLCCSLIHQPKLLLLDELSLGVDPLSRRELWKILHAFREEGVTIVISTPYMEEAGYCDRLCFVHRGRVLAVDTPRRLAQRAQGTTFGIQGGDSARVVEMLAGSLEVAEIRVEGSLVRARTVSADGLRRDTMSAISESADIQAVPPTLEDAFAILSEEGAAETKRLSSAGLVHIASSGADVQEAVAVELTGITCAFGNFVAVDNVTLSVARGEVFGFLGPNGAGKTTLIRVLCGMLRPTAGTAMVAGIDVAREPRRLAKRIGYMSQQFSLYPDLTCAENLSFFGGIYGLDRRAKRIAIDKAVQTLDLREDLDRTAADLSGAVRQRLALACSILHEPEVLFLDEPTSGVDPVSRQRFWQLIRNLARAGVTVFVTTHHLDEARNCDRIGLMSAGHLLAHGDLHELGAGLGLTAAATVEDIFVGYVTRSLRDRKTDQ